MSKKNRHETCFSDNQLVGIFGKKISTQTKRNQAFDQKSRIPLVSCQFNSYFRLRWNVRRLLSEKSDNIVIDSQMKRSRKSYQKQNGNFN